MRDAFPAFSHDPALVYLDSAATTLMPQNVIAAMADYDATSAAPIHRALYPRSMKATERYANARARLAEFINARRHDEIVFTRNTTDAINLVARSLGKQFGPGDEIILTEGEHHANLIPWQMLAEERGVCLRFLSLDANGEISLDELQQLLSAKTRLVTLAYISNSTGIIHPIAKVNELAHQAGAYTLIDAAQAPSHLPLDVQDVDVDFLALSGHKMYGPTGIGILFGKYEILEGMEPIVGGGDMIDQVTLTKSTYQPPPLRFEAGTPSATQVVGLLAAVDFLKSHNVQQVASNEIQLRSAFELGLKTAVPGVSILAENGWRSAISTFTIDQVHPLDLATLLGVRNICLRSGHLCSMTTLQRYQLPSVLRASFGIYNTLEDVDRALQGIIQAVQQLR